MARRCKSLDAGGELVQVLISAHADWLDIVMLRFPEYSAWILALMTISALHCKRISKTVITSEMSKWVDAEKTCMREEPDCHLAVGEGEGNIHWDTVTISDTQHYWIGAKKQKILAWRDSGRPFLKESGCYRSSTSLTDAHTIPQNSPEECFQRCRTQFVALQNSTCFCVPSAVKSEMVSSTRCYLKCSDAQCFHSGGVEAISVYELPDRTVFIKNDTSDSFYWRLDKGNIFVINSTASRQNNHLCVDKAGRFKIRERSPCPYRTTEVTFEEGTNMDELVQAVSNMTEASDGFQLPLRNPTRTRFFWINRLPLESVSGNGGCVSLSKAHNNYTMHGEKCNQAKLHSICTCFTDQEEVLTSEITNLRTTFVTQSTELTAHALLTKTITESGGMSTPNAAGASTTTLLTLVNFTSCSQLEENNMNESSKIMWPCRTQPGPALGSKQRDATEGSSNKLTAIIAAAAAGGVVLIVAVVVAVYMRARRGSKNSIIRRDKYGHVQYPI